MTEIVEIFLVLTVVYGWSWLQKQKGRREAFDEMQEHVEQLIEAKLHDQDTLKTILSIIEMQKNA